jgi:predicted Zn-dependent peptidase
MSQQKVRSIRLWPACLILSLAATVLASSPAPPDPAPPLTDRPAIFDRVEEYRLDNGMLFLLLPRHDVPMVDGAIVVGVGNVDNPEGASGLAHMFEHMAFKGTDRIGTRDAAAEAAVADTLLRVGDELTAELRLGGAADSNRIARLREEIVTLEDRADAYVVPMEWPQTYDRFTYFFNAYTSQDFTVYTAQLPANNLEVWMLMDSERLQHPVFREFYAELEVVKEERRQRAEDSPEGMAQELLKSLAFVEHPYRAPIIGHMADLEGLAPGMLRDFWRAYYAPSNMVAALVGDFEPAEAKRMIDDYFGDIPAGPSPPGIDVVEPPQTEQRRGLHNQGEERRLLMAFPGFGPEDPRRPAAVLLASVLTRDRTSRLVRRLDLEEGAARSVRASATGGLSRYAGLFTITADLLEGVSNERAEEMVWEELDRLRTDPPIQAKLDEIRASYRKGFVFQLQKNADLAEMLATHQASHGDWRQAYERFAAYERVTIDDLADLAGDLFRRARATIVYLEPEAADDHAPRAEGGRP